MIIKNIKNNRGFVILFAVTLSAILLSIALGVANIALKEVNFGTSGKDTNEAFFAADVGVECALLYDKSSYSSFPIAGPAGTPITCASSAPNNITPSYSATGTGGGLYNFTISGLGNAGRACAKVSVSKENPTAIVTIIDSKGYNNGGSAGSCNPSVNGVERELVTTYSLGNFSPPSPAPSPSISGRYVRVQLSGTDFLHLAEVQVLDASSVNLAQNKTAAQSSTLVISNNPVASKAVDGNTDGNYWNNSVSHTNADGNAWWQVDLGSSSNISSVVVWNRTDCCSNRLTDYWVFVSDTPFLSTDTPATLQGRAGTWSSHQTSYPNPSTTITVQ